MAESQKVLISMKLFEQILFLVECLNLSNYEFPKMYKIDSIVNELREKQYSINLRTLYSKAIYSEGAQRNSAIEDYLTVKKKYGPKKDMRVK